jgi:Ankyrin repeats (3 copies)
MAIATSVACSALVFASQGVAGKCLLNYIGVRQPMAPEGQVVRLIRKQHIEATERAFRASNPRTGIYDEASFPPDETPVLTLIARTTSLDPDDCGAPFYAAAFGFPGTLQAMIDRKMDIKAGEAQTGGMNALNAAAMEGALSTVRVLIDRKIFEVDEHAPSYFAMTWLIPGMQGGETAMHWAVLEGNAHIVRYLASRGADVNAKSAAGMTPLGAARSRKRGPSPEMEALLIELGGR